MTISSTHRKLSVFICHAQEDESKARKLYDRLKTEAWIDPWIAEEQLLPGEKWDMKILKVMSTVDNIIICLSKESTTKDGYVQREIKEALDISKNKPDGRIFIVPYLFDNCDVPFCLNHLHHIRFASHSIGDSSLYAYPQLLQALEKCARDLDRKTPAELALDFKDSDDFDLHRFVSIPIGQVPYTFHISKYPITNVQYERFLSSLDFSVNDSIWTEFPKFNENCIQIGQWENEGWKWLKSKSKISGYFPTYWHDAELGIVKHDHPVVAISWYEANAYCKWLLRNWKDSLEELANPDFHPKQIRLPLEIEWSAAAGGENPMSRYPWDKAHIATRNDREIARRANVHYNIGGTTPVNAYLRGISTHGVMDMAGNVWEWQANYYDRSCTGLALRGGAWSFYQYGARVSSRYTFLPDEEALNNVGFRVVCIV
ncbi:MAG: SUMF1/EgtB/PvdO family nonheme iron enzyme [Chloroflexota bacterium]